MGNRRFGILIPREGYFQMAYIAAKGTDAQLRRRGIEAFRADVAELAPELADRVDALTSMDDVQHLDVRLNRLRRWHRPGLLCIGDAAHAMSPIGGVGINLAVQDAVATAALLARPLLDGTVSGRDLARVRNRRLVPTVLVQTLQRLMHRGVVTPILDGRRGGPPRLVQAAMRAVPAASFIPAYLIGVGWRPEHAPAFARPAAAPVTG
jgi:2-polyprenyl-6-methoxyphenol hydroxylase-like FAD-dependent oxidoreductase